jgi:hypothetical protein
MTHAAAAAAAAAGGDVEVSKGSLEQLLDRLVLVCRWCWDLDTAAKLQQELLPQLQQHLAQLFESSSHSQQQQQQIMGELQWALQQHWQFEDAGTASTGLNTAIAGRTSAATTPVPADHASCIAGLREAVVLLVDDCAAALSFCNACCKEPLGPALYSLARGMTMLGRWVWGPCVLGFMCFGFHVFWGPCVFGVHEDWVHE